MISYIYSNGLLDEFSEYDMLMLLAHNWYSFMNWGDQSFEQFSLLCWTFQQLRCGPVQTWCPVDRDIQCTHVCTFTYILFTYTCLHLSCTCAAKHAQHGTHGQCTLTYKHKDIYTHTHTQTHTHYTYTKCSWHCTVPHYFAGTALVWSGLSRAALEPEMRQIQKWCPVTKLHAQLYFTLQIQI